ncbi:glycerol-3-phosphate 1-O-acyltransferase PlsY [Bordetella genomosp. 9]|uniref:glycerol-3-phosphate 1-O-acyltransferase PlsY n=1 Tax=Bordetella genomosp. 9 TaxID=1416803 RepID=UPI000A3231AC|nr:glycerol-3-phosphate 1-O-acyltransferase PlsY [Bordetella genomosp. 9]
MLQISHPVAFNIGLVVLSYLIGSVPFAVVVSRVMGLQDPRTYGSGNPGATNVLRSGSKAAAALTLLGDAAKGWFALWLVKTLSSPVGMTWNVMALSAIAVFLGHLFPVFLKFRGGKGVATALGILFAVSPWLALATVATWIIIAVFFRYSSLAALVAAVFAPLYYLFGGNIAWYTEIPLLAAITLISVLLILRHRANISRLLKGTESRIGEKKKA